MLGHVAACVLRAEDYAAGVKERNVRMSHGMVVGTRNRVDEGLGRMNAGVGQSGVMIDGVEQCTERTGGVKQWALMVGGVSQCGVKSGAVDQSGVLIGGVNQYGASQYGANQCDMKQCVVTAEGEDGGVKAREAKERYGHDRHASVWFPSD